jgi:hypothetical protein
MMMLLTNIEALSNTRQVPDRFDGNFGDGNFTSLVDTNLAIGDKSAFSDTVLKFWNFHVCSGDGNGRSDLNIILVHGFFVQPGREMTVRVHGHNLLGITPLREGSDLCSRLSVSEVWLMSDVEVLAGDGQSIVDGV